MEGKLTPEMEGKLTPEMEDNLTPEQIDQKAFELAEKYCGGVLRSLDLDLSKLETGRRLSKDEALECFRRYDKDGDGFLSAEEFKGALEICGLNITDEEILTEMMKIADLDGDGKLSFEEFAQQMMTTYAEKKMMTT